MRTHILSAFIAMTLLVSCGAKQTTQTQAHLEGGFEHYVYKDSTDRVDITIDITVPVATDSATTLIRDSLIKVIDNEFCYIWGEGRVMESYKGEDNSLKTIIDYYGNNALKEFNKGAEEDYKDRMEYLAEDTTITPEERQQRMEDTPRWEYSSKIEKEYETPKYTVYEHNSYQYLGGAHGGVTGNGSITFNSAGKKIEKFFVDGAEAKMQKLLMTGLMDYFSADSNEKLTQEEVMQWLQIEGNQIPLPARAPYLSAGGLVLTYQQYEIAAYAAGMPSFAIPYKEVMPYLTDEVKSLLDNTVNTH